MQEVNTLLQKNLSKKRSEMNNDIQALLLGVNGPLWYRGMILKEYADDNLTETVLDEMLSYFNASRIVLGHTVVPSIQTLFNGKLIAIDVPHPECRREAGLQALLIEDGEAFVVDEKGDKKRFT